MIALGDVRLVGLNGTTATKLLYSAVFLAGLIVLRWAARWIVRAVLRGRGRTTTRFWARQAINLVTAVVTVLGLLSIWFDDPSKLATGIGLVSAGLAFALQKAVTSVAGYFLILRGDIFSIGDRVVMGGVRGDVIGLGFLRTTILEMGQPEGDVDAAVPMWVQSRQYTGRIVTVTNGVVFDEPIYNYSRDFPYIWEELRVPVKYDADRELVERILLDAAEKHGAHHAGLDTRQMQRMRRRFFLPADDMDLTPQVFYKLTDNWLEMTVRFVVPTHGVRKVKSDMTREILTAFDEHGIGVASGTYAIVELPPVRITDADPAAAYPDEAAQPTPQKVSRRRRATR